MGCNHHDEKLADKGHWSDFLHGNKKRTKKKNSRSKSMFELADNPYADENCCCCNDDDNATNTTNTSLTRHDSLVYSILTSSTLNNNRNEHEDSASISAAALFLLKFSKLLVSCGAPSHRLDFCLQSLMQKFNVKAQFGYFPGFLVVSFGDSGKFYICIYIV